MLSIKAKALCHAHDNHLSDGKKREPCNSVWWWNIRVILAIVVPTVSHVRVACPVEIREDPSCVSGCVIRSHKCYNCLKKETHLIRVLLTRQFWQNLCQYVIHMLHQWHKWTGGLWLIGKNCKEQTSCKPWAPHAQEISTPISSEVKKSALLCEEFSLRNLPAEDNGYMWRTENYSLQTQRVSQTWSMLHLSVVLVQGKWSLKLNA